MSAKFPRGGGGGEQTHSQPAVYHLCLKAVAQCLLYLHRRPRRGKTSVRGLPLGEQTWYHKHIHIKNTGAQTHIRIYVIKSFSLMIDLVFSICVYHITPEYIIDIVYFCMNRLNCPRNQMVLVCCKYVLCYLPSDGGVILITIFCNQRILKRAVRASLEKQLDPEPVFLRKPIATCDLEGGRGQGSSILGSAHGMRVHET